MVSDVSNSPPKPSRALHPHTERNISILKLLCDGTSAETSCHLTAEWTIPCILAGNDCSVGCGRPECARKFAALSTSSAEALFHVHVVNSDGPLPYPVSSSFPPLSYLCVSSHIKQALSFIVWACSTMYSVVWVP